MATTVSGYGCLMRRIQERGSRESDGRNSGGEDISMIEMESVGMRESATDLCTPTQNPNSTKKLRQAPTSNTICMQQFIYKLFFV